MGSLEEEDRKRLIRIEEENRSQSKLLVEISNQLFDGEYTKGIFTAVKQNTNDIENLKESGKKDRSDINRLVEYEKAAKRSLKLFVITVAGWAAALLYWIVSKLSPYIIKAFAVNCFDIKYYA